MTVSLETLTEKELVELNHQIVERLRLLRQMRTHKHMLQFNLGEKVCFDGPDGNLVTGVLTRFNKKTMTVVSKETHTSWNVHPCLIKKFQEVDAPHLKLVKADS